MAVQWADRVKVTTSTTGTGTINLGPAVSGFRTFANAVTAGSLSSGSTVYYVIEDGTLWETGYGTYTAGSPDTLTRTVTASSAGGTTAITLDGSAVVYIASTAQSVLNSNTPSAVSGAQATKAFLDAAIVSGSGTGTLAITPGTFQTVKLTTINSDANSNYNSSTGIYTVPITGIYLITSKVRFGDNSTANVSYGQGVHTSNADGPWFQWFVTYSAGASTARQGSLNLRTASFNSGDQLRLYVFVDTTSLSIASAQLTIELSSQSG